MARPTPKNDRAARAAAMQREAKRQDRRRSIFIWGSLGLVLALIVGAVSFAVVSRPSLAAVTEYEDLGRDHVTEAVEYPQDPPVGGDHNAAWWNCGVYTEPIPAHHAVHSLEHGAVWLTYQPDLPADQIQTLTDLADQEFMLLSPNDEQTSPVAATAWGNQLLLDSADDERLPMFITEFRQGPQTPEPGAACTGGTTQDLVAAP
ncbi:MAG: DUF3105 domain-containing protein [Ornithinimicrobium sp.]